MSAMEIHREWLGEHFQMGPAVGGLPAPVVAALLEAYGKNKWTVDDMGEDGTLPPSQVKYVCALLESLAKGAVARDAKLDTPVLEELDETDFLKLKAWASSRLTLVDEEVDEPVQLEYSEGEREQMARDLAAQHMPEVGQLAFLKLSRHTGFPATATGITGARFDTRPGDMAGGILFRKSKQRNFDELMATAGHRLRPEDRGGGRRKRLAAGA